MVIKRIAIILQFGGWKAGLLPFSKQLAGNHFLTIVGGRENLTALGKLTLWKGAQDIVFERK